MGADTASQDAAPDATMDSVPQVVNQHLTKSLFAYHEVRQMILDGQLAPGERLLLRNLADQLGLSIQPIRDAIKMLERDGLVETESHRGAVVTEISGDTVVELISVRMWLEILAVEEAVPRHTKKSLAEVQNALADAERAMGAKRNGLRYSQANRRLHELIEAPASEQVRELIGDTWDHMWRARRQMSLFSLEAAAVPSAQREHRAIVNAVAGGDTEGAVEAMVRHRASTLKHWERAAASLSARQPVGTG